MKLTEQKKQEMLAAYASGMTINAIAKHYGVHRNTVRPIVQAAKRGMEVSQDWRERFNKLPDLCVDAVERSVTDTKEVHKAASTAQTHLKGVGIYNQDRNVQIKLEQWLGSPLVQRLTMEYKDAVDRDPDDWPATTDYSIKDKDTVQDNTPVIAATESHASEETPTVTLPNETPEELQKEAEERRIAEDRRIAQQYRAQLVRQIYPDL
jgi:transposase-like protein